MSKVAIEGNALGSGTLTIAAPNTNSNFTLTLPENTGTIVTTAGASALTTSGNLAFTGTGNRITGDFSNATHANRVCFQSSVTNGATNFGVIPNGTNQNSRIQAINAADLTNGSTCQIDVSATESAIRAGRFGTGTFLPMTFFTGGAERMRIDTSGNVGIGTSSLTTKLYLFGAGTTSTFFANGDAAGATLALQDSGGGSGNGGQILFGASQGFFAGIKGGIENGTGPAGALIFQTRTTSGNIVDRMRIDSAGNVGIGTSSPNGKLHVSDSTGGTTLRVANTSSSSDHRAVIRLVSATSTFGAGLFQTNGTDAFYPTNSLCAYTFDTQPIVFGTSNTERARIDSSGSLILVGSTAQKATGTTWSNPSDERLKDNIRDYGKGIAELMQVRVREWEYNGKGGTVEGTKGLGVVADEVMVVLPDTVENYEAKLNADDEEVTAIKKFDATEITWLLVKAVQELKAENDSLKARIEALENNNA